MDNRDFKPEGNALTQDTNTLSSAEIESIQRDIEYALEGRGAAVQTPAQRTAGPGLIVIGPDIRAGEKAEEAFSMPGPATESPPPPFYSEAVVRAPRAKRAGWGARAAALLLVCTLGAGTAGVGAGIGAGYARHRIYGADARDSAGYENALSAMAESPDSLPVGIMPAAGLTFADVFAYVAPSVCSINSYAQSSNYFNVPEMLAEAGSGIIFYETDLNVYIVTNHHVVSGASAVTVAFGDSEPVDATSVGSDSLSDVAVICVSRTDMARAGITGYSAAVFGNSDLMSIGDPVMAIGNAMNEGTSATTGIVSGVNKEIPIQNRKLYAIQTNAAINPGNSGGPLVNMRGEVIGMNTAKLSGGNPFFGATVEGMGYSMTSNVIKPIVEDIMKQKQRPFLGIQGADLDQDKADALGIPAVGVLVDAVLPGTSAEAAGIIAGDIITSFNGSTVFTMQQLQDAIKGCQVGDTVDIKVLRGGKASGVTLKATLKAYQENGNF